MHELLLLFFMFSRRMVEVNPCPQASYKDSIKKHIKRGGKMVSVAQGGMVVIKKKSWVGICWCHSVNQWEFNYQPGVEEP